MKELLKLTGLALVMLHLTSCAENIEPEDHDEVSKAQDVHLTRFQKNEKTYNCEGELIKEEIVTTNGVRHAFKIKAKSRKDVSDFSAYGPRTNDTRGMYRSGMGHFTVDMAPTVFNIQVRSGINEIEYKFYTCDSYIEDEEGSMSCAHEPHVSEEGSLYLNVIYKVVLEEGSIERHPSEQECSPNAPEELM